MNHSTPRIRNVGIAATAAFILVAVSPARAGNLISNGDFSAGNTGFTSGYSYNTLNSGPELVEGSYSVVTKANDVHFAWGDYFDHTSGNSSGKYFVANASSDTSTTVWQSGLITVSQANTPYRFEAWLSKIYAAESNPPVLSFQIGDGTTWTNLGQTTSIDEASPGAWVFTYADGQFTSVGNYFVRLKNSNGAGGGNDLGLDDVYFGLRSTAPSGGSTPGEESTRGRQQNLRVIRASEPRSLAVRCVRGHATGIGGGESADERPWLVAGAMARGGGTAGRLW